MLTTTPKFPINLRLTPIRQGLQSQGISLGGAMDQWSHQMALTLIDDIEQQESESLEIISSDSITTKTKVLLVMAGAPRALSVESKALVHGRVHLVEKGLRLNWGPAQRGYRSYLVVRKASSATSHLIGLSRGSTGKLGQWQLPSYIRVILGPEGYSKTSSILKILNTLLVNPLILSPNSNRMGIRLKLCDPNFVDPSINMISQPTNEGSVQVSPQEIMVLMRDRQTVGGYPRLLNVISADIDRLAQYKPEEFFRFKLIDAQAAVAVHQHKTIQFALWRDEILQQQLIRIGSL